MSDEPLPVRLDDTTLVTDPDTGELIAWYGLNTDPERCPAVACTGCDARCTCAPCQCPRCAPQTAQALTDADELDPPADPPLGQLTFSRAAAA